MSSSPISGLDANQYDPDSLYSHLTRVPDPRAKRGRRYTLASVLTIAVGAVMAGAQSFTAIGEWAGDLTDDQLTSVGLQSAPEESGLRKLCARINATALEKSVAAFIYTRTRVLAGRSIIAIDGKTVRGARTQAARAPHLLAAVEHDHGIVYGQSAVDATTNEIPAARDLIATFDSTLVTGSVITLDAMHTQTATANLIASLGADYIFTAWSQVPATTSRQRHRGGQTTRTIKTVNVPEWVDFPPRQAGCPAASDTDGQGQEDR